MINLPYTLYNDADSEALLNAQQALIDGLGRPLTMVRLDIQAFTVAPIPDTLLAAYNAGNYAKRFAMIGIAFDVMSTNLTELYEDAYQTIYDTLYP